MAFALAACGGKPVVIENPACVAKTFPAYFDELAHLTSPRAAGSAGGRVV
jgi:3-phosphoshikimate 1-carboxyvinyltransferase